MQVINKGINMSENLNKESPDNNSVPSSTDNMNVDDNSPSTHNEEVVPPNIPQEPEQEQRVHVEPSLTDHLNKRLLNAFLERLNNMNPPTIYGMNI